MVATSAPQTVRTCLNLGSAYAAAGFPVLAEREWERCLVLDPTFAAGRENLARLRARNPAMR